MGQPLERIRLASPFLLRTAQPSITDAEGRVVRELRRVGKRIGIGVEGDLWLVLHLMIAGRLHWRAAGAALAGRRNLAAFDFPEGSLTLTEAGTQHRASLHILSGEEGLRSVDPGGIDVFTADLAAFRAALTAENHTLKRALTDPRVLSGIGNAYSDEILHAAQLSPIAQTHKLKPEEWDRLFALLSCAPQRDTAAQRSGKRTNLDQRMLHNRESGFVRAIGQQGKHAGGQATLCSSFVDHVAHARGSLRMRGMCLDDHRAADGESRRGIAAGDGKCQRKIARRKYDGRPERAQT